MTAAAHSKLGPSSAKRWMACPGSVAMCEAYPEERSSKYADEGSVAHWVAETALAKITAGVPFDWAGYVGNFAPDYPDIAISWEMIDYVKTYVDYVLLVKGTDTLRIEERYDISWVHPGIFGTSDATVYHPATKHLDVIDLKYGKGVAVEAEENLQGVLYALGAAASVWEEVQTISIHIHQPRISSEPSVWTLTVEELRQLAAVLKTGAAAAVVDNAPRLYSSEACRWCAGRQTDKATGKPRCAEYHTATAMSANAIPVKPVDTLTPADAVRELEMLEAADTLIADRLTALRIWMTEQADHIGVEFPGRKLVSKRSQRKWADAEEVATVLQFGYGVDEEQLYARSFKSPAQIEALRDEETGEKIIAPSVVKEYIERKDNGVELVALSDKRAAIAPRKLVAPDSVTKPFVLGDN